MVRGNLSRAKRGISEEEAMRKERDKINCSIFQKQEIAIKDLTDKINAAKQVQEKAKFACELGKEVDVLFNCPEFKKESLDCESCHFIANLRKRTADLIIKAKKLA